MISIFFTLCQEFRNSWGLHGSRWWWTRTWGRVSAPCWWSSCRWSWFSEAGKACQSRWPSGKAYFTQKILLVKFLTFSKIEQIFLSTWYRLRGFDVFETYVKRNNCFKSLLGRRSCQRRWRRLKLRPWRWKFRMTWTIGNLNFFFRNLWCR